MSHSIAYSEVMNSRPVRDDLADVGPAIEWAGQLVDQAKLSPDVRFAVDLGLEEALANLIMHGQSRGRAKDIVVSVAAGGEEAVVTISDHCAPFDVTRRQAAEGNAGLTAGGRGLKLLHAFTGELTYDSKDDQNTLTMRFPAA